MAGNPIARPANPVARTGPPRIPAIIPTGFPGGHVIPDVAGVGLVPRDTLARGPSITQQQQLNVAAAGAPIALPFGLNRVAVKPMQPVVLSDNSSGGHLLIPCMIGAGEIDGIVSVEFDNKPAPGGVSWTVYTGTQTQGIDPDLQTAWAALGKTYADTLPGIAYIVLKVPYGDVQNAFQNVAVTFRGLKVYDPRDGTQTQGVRSTYKYSDNPVLHEAYFLNEPGVGPEETLDWSSVATCADISDQLCGTGPQQEKRRICGLYFDQQQEVGQIEEQIRAHAGIWVVREGDVTRFVPDTPATSEFSFTAADYVLDSLQITKRGRGNSPTVVTIQWTDRTSSPWKQAETTVKADGVDSGAVPWIESVVQMAGVPQPGQAYREGVRRLNDFLLSDLVIKFVAMDEGGAKVMKGTVFDFTDSEGFAGKLFRCTDAFPLEPGRWQIIASEYQSAVYSDSPATGPGFPDTSLPDPRVIDAPTNLALSEVVYPEKNIASDGLARGFIYQSRASATVTPPVHAFPFVYEWELWLDATRIDVQVTAAPAYASPPVQQGNTYTLKVWARNSVGARSANPLTGSLTAQGKLLHPGPIPSLTRATEIGGEVFIDWNPAIDIDVTRYEWRYTPNQTAGGSWATATFIDRIDGLSARFKGLPVGTHRFYGRAIDSVGNYSDTDITADITVTSDASAFLQSKTFANPQAVTDSQLAMTTPPVWAVGTTGWAETPDSAKVSVTGDIDIRVDVYMPNAPSPDWTFVSKYPLASGQCSYILWVRSTGQLVMSWSQDGTAAPGASASSTANIAFGKRIQIRATVDMDNGAGGHTVTFYTNGGADSELASWTQLGTAVTAAGVSSIFDGTSPLRVAVQDETTGTSPMLACRIYRAMVMNGINGTIAADFYPARDAAGESAASFVAATSGETWTISYPPMIRNGGAFMPEKINNGMFAASSSWSFGAGGSISGGNAVITAAAANAVPIAQSVAQMLSRTSVPGGLYRVALSVVSVSAGSFCIGVGPNAASRTAFFNAPGTYIAYVATDSASDGSVGFVAGPAGCTAAIDWISLVECNNIEAIPQLEGTWLQRWATAFGSDKFTAVEPNPFNSGGNPVNSYHAAGTSAFIGEWWDLGASVSGDWTLTPNATDVSGTATYAIDTSFDGVAVTTQPGLSFKGQTRFARPRILTTGTVRVDQPPKITLAALARVETGQSTSLSSGGKLIQLTGQYVGATDLQVTPVNTSSPRMASVDRILINPQTGLMLKYDFNGSGDNSVEWYYNKSFSRVIASGDFIEFDVYIDPSSPATTTYAYGGVLIGFSDGTNTGGAFDTDGYQLHAPVVGMDALARGQWHARKASLASYVGKTATSSSLCNEGDASSGTAKVLYRNIRFTDGAGTVRQQLWSSGEPVDNSVASSVLTTNIQMGPSNSFLVYVFTDAGAQVAQDFKYSFRGY